MSEDTKPTIDVYGSENAPAAADFSRGAVSLNNIKDAAEARNRLSDQQSTSERGPIARDQ